MFLFIFLLTFCVFFCSFFCIFTIIVSYSVKLQLWRGRFCIYDHSFRNIILLRNDRLSADKRELKHFAHDFRFTTSATWLPPFFITKTCVHCSECERTLPSRWILNVEALCLTRQSWPSLSAQKRRKREKIKESDITRLHRLFAENTALS